MRRILAAAAAVLALSASVSDAAVNSGAATVMFRANDPGLTRFLEGACTWDGAVLVGYAESVAVPPYTTLDINVRCLLTDQWGAILAEVHEGSAGPPVRGATIAALPNNAPARLCGWANAYFGGTSLTYRLSASGCATPVNP